MDYKQEMELMQFRLKCEKMDKKELKKLFNTLSKEEKRKGLSPKDREIAKEKTRIAGLVLTLDGKGAQG